MRADRIVRQHLRQRFVVTLRDGTSFEGLLLEADGHTLRLTDASALRANGDRVKADGEVFLPRRDIAYMQLPPVKTD